jgi:hypothetical protein
MNTKTRDAKPVIGVAIAGIVTEYCKLKGDGGGCGIAVVARCSEWYNSIRRNVSVKQSLKACVMRSSSVTSIGHPDADSKRHSDMARMGN